MTYTYIASTNTLKEVPTMNKPNSKHYADQKAYNAHLASLKEIACEPGCKDVWKDGDTVVEGRDFKITFEACADHHLLAEMYRCQDCKLVAIPITAESEDDLFMELFDYLPDRLLYQTRLRIVADWKQKYTIAKKK